ncbi:hypothetical protein DCAR_0209353 [Daucus carota subsp. sativus]|uniref:Uncharacterized protein n=1 Tax=Daucus carota subsp. sativus TaxID=79200 RepID=A0AAF0WHQ3_DAUCS|nr:hypothetical protein DCAR_0209353 [Daucus carota subsp. sativus]
MLALIRAAQKHGGAIPTFSRIPKKKPSFFFHYHLI